MAQELHPGIQENEGRVTTAVSKPQLLSDEIAKTLFYLGVTRYRSLFSILWVCINIVISTMPFQVATGIDELPSEISSFHTISRAISLVFTSGG